MNVSKIVGKRVSAAHSRLPAAESLLCRRRVLEVGDRGEGGYLVKLPWAAERGNRRGRGQLPVKAADEAVKAVPLGGRGRRWCKSDG